MVIMIIGTTIIMHIIQSAIPCYKGTDGHVFCQSCVHSHCCCGDGNCDGDDHENGDVSSCLETLPSETGRWFGHVGQQICESAHHPMCSDEKSGR